MFKKKLDAYHEEVIAHIKDKINKKGRTDIQVGNSLVRMYWDTSGLISKHETVSIKIGTSKYHSIDDYPLDTLCRIADQLS